MDSTLKTLVMKAIEESLPKDMVSIVVDAINEGNDAKKREESVSKSFDALREEHDKLKEQLRIAKGNIAEQARLIEWEEELKNKELALANIDLEYQLKAQKSITAHLLEINVNLTKNAEYRKSIMRNFTSSYTDGAPDNCYGEDEIITEE